MLPLIPWILALLSILAAAALDLPSKLARLCARVGGGALRLPLVSQAASATDSSAPTGVLPTAIHAPTPRSLSHSFEPRPPSPSPLRGRAQKALGFKLGLGRFQRARSVGAVLPRFRAPSDPDVLDHPYGRLGIESVPPTPPPGGVQLVDLSDSSHPYQPQHRRAASASFDSLSLSLQPSANPFADPPGSQPSAFDRTYSWGSISQFSTSSSGLANANLLVDLTPSSPPVLPARPPDAHVHDEAHVRSHLSLHPGVLIDIRLDVLIDSNPEELEYELVDVSVPPSPSPHPVGWLDQPLVPQPRAALPEAGVAGDNKPVAVAVTASTDTITQGETSLGLPAEPPADEESIVEEEILLFSNAITRQSDAERAEAIHIDEDELSDDEPMHRHFAALGITTLTNPLRPDDDLSLVKTPIQIHSHLPSPPLSPPPLPASRRRSPDVPLLSEDAESKEQSEIPPALQIDLPLRPNNGFLFSEEPDLPPASGPYESSTYAVDIDAVMQGLREREKELADAECKSVEEEQSEPELLVDFSHAQPPANSDPEPWKWDVWEAHTEPPEETAVEEPVAEPVAVEDSAPAVDPATELAIVADEAVLLLVPVASETDVQPPSAISEHDVVPSPVEETLDTPDVAPPLTGAAVDIPVEEDIAEKSHDEVDAPSSDGAPLKIDIPAAKTPEIEDPPSPTLPPDSQLKQRRRMPPAPLDAALAMQLRPGLGLGADGAWLVRFLMSFFGWLAVLVSAGRATRRATPVAAAAAAGAKKPVVDEKPAGEREQSSTDASQALVAVK